jgi:hypothetical protein
MAVKLKHFGSEITPYEKCTLLILVFYYTGHNVLHNWPHNFAYTHRAPGSEVDVM